MTWCMDLPRRTASEKKLCGKAFNIDKKTKYDGYQGGVASMVYKFFNKDSSGSGVMVNQQLLFICIGIASSVIGLKICVILTAIKKCKSIIKKKSMMK